MAISESSDYKEDLLKEVRKIKRLLRTCDISDLGTYYFKLEKFLFVSAYLIRKLIEAQKLSDELENESIRLEYSKVTDYSAVCDFLSKRHLLRNYDIHHRRVEDLRLADVTNIFIHSYVFCLSLTSGGLPGESEDPLEHFELLITSDYRKSKLYFFRLDTYLNLCTSVARDEIVNMEISMDEKLGYRTVKRKSRKAE